MCLVRSWLLRSLLDQCCSRGIESTLFEDLTLSGLVSFLGNSETIIEILSVQDSLGVFCKLIAEKRTLLFLMGLTHMTSFVNIRCGTSIERSVILVEVFVRGSLSAMETSKVSPEVWILAHASVDAEAAGDCL